MQKITPTPALQIIVSLLWDESVLIDDRTRDLLQSGMAETESKAREMALLDHDFLEFEYDDFLENFTGILSAISPAGRFLIEGRNMGWRHLSGSLEIEATDARAFIARAFPKTSEWILRGIYDLESKVLCYTLTHHDAPTGEYYQVQAF